jgi:hypothetical protein
MDTEDVYDPNAEVLGELGAFSPDYDPRGISLVRNSLPIEETVFDAARRGDVAHLRRLIEVPGEAVNQYDTFDASPLYCACCVLSFREGMCTWMCTLQLVGCLSRRCRLMLRAA